MRLLGGIFLCAVWLCACGDSGVGGSRSAQVCDEICNVPDQCFEELDIPTEDVDCFDACAAQIEEVGVDCVNAILETINCLPSCDVDALTDEDLLACQDEALAIGTACDS